VPMILAAIVIARNPMQYGFSFEAEAVQSYETVELTYPVDLRRVAEWADRAVDEVQALNPELRRWTTPVRDGSYVLKVPIGTAATVRARLDEAARLELASLKWYTVKNGDNLALIARKLHVSRSDLAEANYLKVTAHVSPGDKLMVPQEATALMAAQTDRPAPPVESQTLVANAAVSDGAADPERSKIIYQVKQGDTLGSIARVYKTTVGSLQAWNNISGARIRVGERLTIYTARAN